MMFKHIKWSDRPSESSTDRVTEWTACTELEKVDDENLFLPCDL